MSIIDDVVVNAKSVADVVGKKAGKIIDVSKLKLTASEISSELSKKYEALGRFVYELDKNDEFELDKLNNNLWEIKELEHQLEAVKNSIAAQSNKAVCPDCGCENVKTAFFCNNCGKALK